MIEKPERGLFFTGTDTDIGKTYVASLVARTLTAQGHKVGVYKPVSSDCQREGDALISFDAMSMWKAAGEPLDLETVCPQRFEAPLAPNVAAAKEGKQVDSELLRTGVSKWSGHCDILLVEGIGGLMSPVSDDEFVADLAYDLGYPLIVVTPNHLGTINQTLQTLITAATFQNGLPVAGVVLNNPGTNLDDESSASNRDQIARHAVPPILAELDYGADSFSQQVDWFELAQTDPHLRDNEVDW